jgi:hypothetical protein
MCQVAAQLVAYVVVTTLETVAVIALLAQTSPVKALLAVTTQTVVARQLNAQRKVAVVVRSAAVAVALVATRVILAMEVVMTFNPAIFVTTQVAM